MRTSVKTEIKETHKLGRGVFATQNFKKGDIVESSPVIVVNNTSALRSTILNTYIFDWNRESLAIALGNGSLFNHSKKANVTYNPSYQSKIILFVAKRDIKKGQQLFIDYGYDPKWGYKTTERSMYEALKRKFDSIEERVRRTDMSDDLDKEHPAKDKEPMHKEKHAEAACSN